MGRTKRRDILHHIRISVTMQCATKYEYFLVFLLLTLLLPLTQRRFTAETIYLYPESRLIVCVGLWQFSHDFHTTDGTSVGIFWWRTAACSLQQHGVFTHCGFTTTSNKTPKRTMWLQQNHTCNNNLFHSSSVRFGISIKKKLKILWPFYSNSCETLKDEISHLRQIQIRLHQRWCRSAEQHHCPSPKWCHLDSAEAP